MTIKEFLEFSKHFDPETDVKELMYQLQAETLYDEAINHPGLFVEFPTPNYERIVVLNPKLINQDIKDALVRFVHGDEMADVMLHNRAILDKCLKER